MTGTGEIGGHCAPGYEGIRDAFASCFTELGETGAAVSCTVDGRLVVDLYGGWSDADRLRPWSPSTLVHVWSVTKPLAALALLFLVDRGLVGLDEQVVAHWPEYAAAGKETTTIRQLLAHQAGLAEVPEHVTLELLTDHEALASRLAGARPEWLPGTQHGEHALLYGTLLGEIVRRVDGRSLGTLLRAEITGPWQIDFHVGLSPQERGRAAELVDEGGRWRSQVMASPFSRVLGRPPEVLDVATTNSERWRAAEVAAVNGHATAVGVARLHAAIAAGGELDGVRLLSAETVDELLRPQAQGHDVVLDSDAVWGLGVRLDDDGSWGMGGVGGSLGYGRRAPRAASFGYVTARMGDHDRAARCADAFDAALGSMT